MSNLGDAQELGLTNKGLYKRIPARKYEAGDVIGEWTIIKAEPNYRYRAQCSCGTITSVSSHSLRYNLSKKCQFCGIRERRKNRHKRQPLIFEGKI